MSHSALADGLRLLRDKLALQQRRQDSEEQLLRTFASQRDENAFATLVRRHGSMVFQVCRRVLEHEQDAEDAFQATFLVLARTAKALRKKSSLASFLHGTAYRLALNAKRAAARRHKCEAKASARPSVDPAEEMLWRETRALLDEEIACLPEKYRTVFVLCCLEELSQAEAGRRLGLKARTASNRLAAARKRLSQRLARRGVELTAVLAAPALAAQRAPALSSLLISTTIKAASGEGTAGLVSANVAALMKSATWLAMLSKTTIATAMLVVLSVLAGVGAWCISANKLRLGAPTPSDGRSQSKRESEEVNPRREKSDVATVEGRVLGLDDKPVQGARLYSARVQNVWPRNDAVVTLAQPDPTAADGRFHITTNRPGDDEFVYLIAHAPGLGVDWIDLGEDQRQQEVTLRLPNDVPIIGRIVNTEGRPVAGVSVSVAQIGASANEKLDEYLASWLRNFRVNNQAGATLQKWLFAPLDGVLGKATTDKDGRFTLHGAGSERIVPVAFSGAGVARTTPWIISRPKFDVKPYNAVLRNKDHEYLLRYNRFPGLFPPSFTFIAEAGRTI